MITFTYDENIFSDLHKDTYGFRPRNHRFYDAPPKEKQEIWDDTIKEFYKEQERQEELKKSSITEWRSRISQMQNDYTINKDKAILWDMESFGCYCFDPIDETEDYDIGYYCYLNGFICSKIESEISQALLNIKKDENNLK